MTVLRHNPNSLGRGVGGDKIPIEFFLALYSRLTALAASHLGLAFWGTEGNLLIRLAQGPSSTSLLCRQRLGLRSTYSMQETAASVFYEGT